MVQHSTDKFCAKFLSYKIGLSVKVSLEWVPFFVLETKLSHHIFRCIFTYQNVKPMFFVTGLSLMHLCVLKLVKLALPLLFLLLLLLLQYLTLHYIQKLPTTYNVNVTYNLTIITKLTILTLFTILITYITIISYITIC